MKSLSLPKRCRTSTRRAGLRGGVGHPVFDWGRPAARRAAEAPNAWRACTRKSQWDYRTDPVKLINGALFDVDYDEMVLVKDIESTACASTTCCPSSARPTWPTSQRQGDRVEQDPRIVRCTRAGCRCRRMTARSPSSCRYAAGQRRGGGGSRASTCAR